MTENILKPQKHICPVCGKKCKWLAVYDINPQSPCSEKCRLTQKKEKHG